MKIYLAGPISGLEYDEVISLYRAKTYKLRSYGYEVLCPMTGKSHLRNEVELKPYGLNDHPTSTNHAIFERDRWMVQNCDIVLADLSNSGSRVSIGTMMELAWASGFGKHSVVVMDENNIHQHAFVLESADILFSDINSAYTYLAELAKGL